MKSHFTLRGLQFAFVWALCGAVVPPIQAAPVTPSETKVGTPEPAKMDAQLATKLAAKEDLFAAIREIATTLKPYYQQLYLAGGAASQRKLIDRLADSHHISAADELEELFTSMQTQLDASGSISTVRAPVYAPNGQATDREVLRIGNFSFIAEGRYLLYSPEVDRLVESPRQPDSSLVNMALDFTKADSTSLAPAAIDLGCRNTADLNVF